MSARAPVAGGAPACAAGDRSAFGLGAFGACGGEVTYDTRGRRRLALGRLDMERDVCRLLAGDASRDSLGRSRLDFRGWGVMGVDMASAAAWEMVVSALG